MDLQDVDNLLEELAIQGDKEKKSRSLRSIAINRTMMKPDLE